MSNQIENQINLAPESWRGILTEFDSSHKTGIGTNRKVRDTTRLFYIKYLSKFARKTNTHYNTLTMNELKEYIGTIENQSSQRNICLTLKKFLKYVGRKDLAEQISLAPIRMSERKDKIDRITAEEVNKLLASEDSARNRALIAVFYESAGRLSEIVNLKVKDVQPDKYGFIVKLFGKTELRNIRLVASAPYLTTWLNLHTARNNPEAPLFYAQGRAEMATGKITPLQKGMIAKAIRNAAKGAGFTNLEKFHPHAFRHGRLSELGHSLTDSELKFLGGWSDEARRMVSLYAHMDGDRVNAKLLNLQGLTEEEETKQSELNVLPCPRCKTLNGSAMTFCGTCGAPLTAEGLQSIEQKDRESQELQETVAQMQAFMANFSKAMNGQITDNFQEKFEAAARESKRRDEAMKEYFEKHPELTRNPEEKPSLEELEKAQKGFEEWYRKKKAR